MSYTLIKSCLRYFQVFGERIMKVAMRHSCDEVAVILCVHQVVCEGRARQLVESCGSRCCISVFCDRDITCRPYRASLKAVGCEWIFD